MRTGVLLLAVAAGLAGGCAPPGAGPTGRGAGPAVAVADCTFASLDAAVAAHKGEIVLVDFWATWCGPCRDGFPHVVALHNRYADRGLAVIAVSIDDPGDGYRVAAFLREKRAAFQNFHWKDWGAERAAFRQRFGFTGTIPLTVAFDRTGGRAWDSAAQPLGPRGVEEVVERLLDAR